MTFFKMALESMLDKKGRSFLTMLGIIIGVCSVLVLVSLVNGYQADVTAYYEKLGVNKVTATITLYDQTTLDMTDILYEYGNNDMANVTGVTPDISTTGTLKYKGTTEDTSTIYLGGDQFATCCNYTLESGRDINKLDIEKRNNICIIGSYVALTLFGYADPIDQTIYVNGYPFTVVGTYYQKDGSTEESMDDMIVLPYSLNRSLLGSAYITSYIFKVDTSTNMTSVMSELETFLAGYLDEDVNGTYELENGNSELSATQDETASYSVVLGGIAGIALLVGGIGIMNIMLVTVTERTREIGIKKAIGAQRQAIVNQFLVESGTLSATGGVIGILLGFGLSLVLGKAIFDVITFPSAFITIGAFMFSIVIGVGFGMYPAVKASGLQPVEALRAE